MENKNEIIENENLNTNNTANNDSKKSKKKLIIIISSIVAGLAIIAAIVVVLVVMLNKNNLSPEEKFNNMISEINTNLKDSTNIKYSSTFKDGDVVVAEIEREVMVSKNTENDTVNLTVSTTENKLGSSFILESSNYTTYYDGKLPEKLFNYNFTYSSFSEIEVSDTSIIGIVKNSEVSNVLNNTVNNSSDLDVIINYEDGRITSFTFTYTSTNNKNVVITANYTY